MKVTKSLRILVPAVVALLAVVAPTSAQFQRQQQLPPQQQQQQPQMPPPDQQQMDQQPELDEDGPGRGVARISLMNGEVSVKRGDTGDLVAGILNAPLMVSDSVLTANGARAELQFDSANLLRMAPGSEIKMSELEWQRYMIQVAGGTITFRVIRNSEAQIELNTPSVAIRPLKKGEYRISVHEDGTTEITVRSGEVEVVTARGTERLKSGKTMLARGTANDPEFQIVSAPQRDEFDQWNQDRDKYFERSQVYSDNSVSQDVYGAEDLDGNGTWTNNPQYGRVWVPRVNADWAPYQNGRWVYYDWYGWTWVSYDTWGWAPYHYGRWFYDASVGWGWWPGGVGRRHYWRPAYVSFVGWGGRGGGLSVGIGFGGFGNVGWVPLAPYEPCYGWWGRNRYNGWRNGNYGGTRIVSNVNITNIYRNARVANGITSVNANDFGRNRIGRDNIIRTRASDLQGAGMVRGNLPVAPDRHASIRLSDRDARYAGTGHSNDRVFRTREPARVDRVPFEVQRRGVEEQARRSYGNNGSINRGEMGSRPVTGDNGGFRQRQDQQPRGNSGNVDGNNNGWRRFGESRRPGGDPAATPGSSQPGRVAERQRSDDWQRFGNSSRGAEGGQQPVTQRPERTNEGARPARLDSGDNGSFSSPTVRQRYDQPRQQQQQPQRVERSPEPVRISPPIVQRSNDGGGFGRSSRSSDSGGSSPRVSNGGGGGGRSSDSGASRSSGGGGGSSRSGGGGESRGGGGGGGSRGSGGGGRNK